MPNGIFIHINTIDNRQASFRFKETFWTDNPMPIELSKIMQICVGFKSLYKPISETKYKVFDISEYENDELKMITDFYSFLVKLIEKDKSSLVLGYDIKRYILPSLLKLIVLKYNIVKYEQLPAVIKIKDLKPWDPSSVIDIKDESSLGGYGVPFEYFKFFHSFEGTDIKDEVEFIISKSGL